MTPVTDEKQTTSTTSTGADDQTPGKPLSSKTKAGKSAKPAKHATKKGTTKKGASKQTKPEKLAKPAKKASPAKLPAKKAADRSNKKAEVIAMMKSAKGATLPEIMAVTGWQKHTVRGFVSILGSKGGHSIESSKNAAGERTYKIAK